METVEVKPQLVANRRGVAFDISRQSSAAECVISIATLEVNFCLGPGASEAQIVKCFRDGYARIRAMAERKLLAHPAPRIELTPDDFARR
ncbi:DUF1488 family protein [Paraburkholderia sp. RCC_158]|uniref:DUF1488 family protein n=1 Tax=Paraburkholderia sp. RCC_158 TaxID=3239220 RepID=UPI00352316DC